MNTTCFLFILYSTNTGADKTGPVWAGPAENEKPGRMEKNEKELEI